MSPVEPAISLREVTKEMVRAICRLEVTPEQRGFVAPNAVSFAEALFSPDVAWFRAVYDGEVPVGFVMLSDDPSKPEYYLWRFMIDAAHQRRGLGRRALELVIEYVRTRPGARELLTSIVPGDGSPGPFYESLGFTYTGVEDDGELVMRRGL